MKNRIKCPIKVKFNFSETEKELREENARLRNILNDSKELNEAINERNKAIFSLVMSEEKINKVLKYCKGKTDYVWAATIVSILLNCDFRDAKETLEERVK